jgi:LysM repeat protein
MKPSALLLLPAAIVVSCAPHPEEYDTPPPYHLADASQIGNAANPHGPSRDPLYESPAVYEETPATPDFVASPGLAAEPSAALAPAAPAAPQYRSTIVHTVERGDTLSGLSSKYKVPIQAIQEANGMTNDIVVLGRKMVIPQP